MRQWVGHSGAPLFHVSYNYIHKKNLIELHMTQDTPRGGSGGGNKFVVSLYVAIYICNAVHVHCRSGPNQTLLASFGVPPVYTVNTACNCMGWPTKMCLCKRSILLLGGQFSLFMM